MEENGPHGWLTLHLGRCLILQGEHFNRDARRHHRMICVTPRSFESIKLKGGIVPFGHSSVHQRIGLMMDSPLQGGLPADRANKT